MKKGSLLWFWVECYCLCRHVGQQTYETWESFSYEDHSQKLTKEVCVYLPYGYDENEKYNVFYLSHGGWTVYGRAGKTTGA